MPQDIEQFRGVWTFAEQRGGSLEKVSLEILAAGRQLANKLNVGLHTMLLGYHVENLCKELIAHGADLIYLAESPLLKDYQVSTYAKVITDLVRNYRPEFVLFGATYIGRDLAPRVARRLGTGLTADCTGFEIDIERRMLLQIRPAFGGNLIATVVCPKHRPQMATVRPGVMKELERDEGRKGRVLNVKVSLTPEDELVRILKVVREAKRRESLETAKIIVSGGRGVGSPEGFDKLRELADLLGGEVAGSRVAIEKGWLPSDRQVGQTGKTVRPDLYIACGISGSIQHRAGMQNSRCIVAVNKDPDAEIFKIAHYGIIGDLHEILPKMVDEVRKWRSMT